MHSRYNLRLSGGKIHPPARDMGSDTAPATHHKTPALPRKRGTACRPSASPAHSGRGPLPHWLGSGLRMERSVFL
eukprot:scaffold134902_cov31-Tisochrysis_lutea.AAC.3